MIRSASLRTGLGRVDQPNNESRHRLCNREKCFELKAKVEETVFRKKTVRDPRSIRQHVANHACVTVHSEVDLFMPLFPMAIADLPPATGVHGKAAFSMSLIATSTARAANYAL